VIVPAARVRTAAPAPIGDTSLPPSEPAFEGAIGDTYKSSKSDFPQPVAPPTGAPNVLIVLIDDLGFAGPQAYGGLIPTPDIDAFVGQGLIYKRSITLRHCAMLAHARRAPHGPQSSPAGHGEHY
jgi:hypothetical protein